MKDFEALSRKHFDRQAAEYDQRDTYYYSQNGKIRKESSAAVSCAGAVQYPGRGKHCRRSDVPRLVYSVFDLRSPLRKG